MLHQKAAWPTGSRLSDHPRRHRALVLNDRGLDRIDQVAAERGGELDQAGLGDQVALASIRQEKAPGSERPYARFDADRRGEPAEEQSVPLQQPPTFPQHRLEMFIVPREVQDRTADHEVNATVRKRHFLDWFDPEVVGRQIRREPPRHRSDGVDRCGIGVHGTNVVAFAKEVDEVPPGTAAGIADARTDRKSTRLNSSHLVTSYAVFCLKKKSKTKTRRR